MCYATGSPVVFNDDNDDNDDDERDVCYATGSPVVQMLGSGQRGSKSRTWLTDGLPSSSASA